MSNGGRVGSGRFARALVPEARLHPLCEIVVRETPSLGVRYHAVGRWALERRFDEVETSHGIVPIKVGLLAGEIVGGAPEWEVCLALARERKVPVRQVREEALARWLATRT